MNDRYLYRAKTDNGEWVEGYYFKRKIYKDSSAVEHFIMTSKEPKSGRLCKTIFFAIDPSTICQCTGLKDKNGKLIWENDILIGHLDDQYPEDTTYSRVIWNKNGFYKKGQDSDDISLIDDFDEEYFEVIGNIFDNPELLEVGE